MLFVIISGMAIVLTLIYLINISKRGKLFELKNDFKVSFPAVLSNVEDILFMRNDRVSLFKQNRIVVLTGGNRGIGLHVLSKLLVCDMTVVLGVRNPELARKSVESAIDSKLLSGKVFYEKCDTGDLQSVRDFAATVKAKFPKVHLLINNAGILYVPYEITKDGFESQMAINYLGHFLLSHLLLPNLIAGSSDGNNSRVVNVSSCANEAGSLNYDDFNYEKYYHTGLAYGDTKLAQIMFTKYLNEICKVNDWKVQSNAVHPGIVDTEIFKNSVWGSLTWLRQLIFKTPERGSRTIVYAAISPDIEDLGGSYLSNCKVTRTNPIANDQRECKKFFDFTCELLKIKTFGEV